MEVTDAEPQALEVESESVETAATTDAEPQTLEIESQSAEPAEPAQREEAPEDGAVDSLLDLFRGEQISENPISELSRELSDTSVHSLLEEMKQIAEKVRKRP